MGSYSNKIVIITGAAQGIGKGLARAYALRDATVIAIDITEMSIEHPNIVNHTCDVSKGASVSTLFERIIQRYGLPDILINNASITDFHKPITEISDEEFAKVIEVNLHGTFFCSRAFLKARKGIKGYGRIINIASTRYLQSEENWEAYSASKGGVVAFTHSLAISLSNTGITVNSICPGWIDSGHYPINDSDHLQHPSGRVGRIEDIVKAALYLSDPENDFITGQNLIVDGGMTKKMIYL